MYKGHLKGRKPQGEQAMKKEAKNTNQFSVDVTDSGLVIVKIDGQFDYNAVNVLMDKLKKAQSAASELLKLAKRKELLKANYK
jgi:biopolymer transport protein ExbD